MVNNDASTELVVSNTLQPMNLIMSDNKIEKQTAHIFINTECKGQAYHDVEQKAMDATTLYSEVLRV